jgi:hypothetical protein
MDSHKVLEALIEEVRVRADGMANVSMRRYAFLQCLSSHLSCAISYARHNEVPPREVVNQWLREICELEGTVTATTKDTG